MGISSYKLWRETLVSRVQLEYGMQGLTSSHETWRKPYPKMGETYKIPGAEFELNDEKVKKNGGAGEGGGRINRWVSSFLNT